MRNARLLRRGEPPIKDVVFVTLWPLHAIVGAISGAITAGITESWPAGAIAGAGLPALGTLAASAHALAQLRR